MRILFILSALVLLLGCMSDDNGAEGTEPSNQVAVDSTPEPPPGAEQEFSTDFSRHTVPYEEILSGGPPKDGIPAVDEPSYWSVDEADEVLAPREPVIVVDLEKHVRVYPLRILMWHEIVNDTLGEEPIAVTYCPLCNTGVVFSRSFKGDVLDFGTTGRLRRSNLIMYDRQTESWWQQATGNALAGVHAGKSLEMVPSLMFSWRDAKEKYPETTVLSTDTGYSRPYGNNPYQRYDNPGNEPFLYKGPNLPSVPETYSPVERAVVVKIGGEQHIIPYSELRENPVRNITSDGEGIVVLWSGGTASALDTGKISEGKDVGSANAFKSRVVGRDLTFTFENGKLRDEQTGSVWNGSGTAVSGPLAGTRLKPAISVQHFWFSAHAFAQ
jgi:hypothetical protein